MVYSDKHPSLPDAAQALPDRPVPLPVADKHFVLGSRICPPFDGHLGQAVFALGCFWGAERIFWELDGVESTAVGYAGGHTANPTYQDVCSGMTGHTEVINVVFDPLVIGYETLLAHFWESHDPTQGMRQGNDRGSQYRSAIYTLDASQARAAEDSRDAYQKALAAAGHASITTEIAPLRQFFYAEEHHQQYLAKNPGGYCGIGGTGISCPAGPTPAQ